MNNAVLTAGDRLQVRFIRVGDRWAHYLEGDGARQSPARFLEASLFSYEGTAEEKWPPSPPFQSLVMQGAPAGIQRALLVGMAGGSHWSASVEADLIRERITFDVACRAAAEPKWLGSTYDAPVEQRASGIAYEATRTGLIDATIVTPCIELDESVLDAGVRCTMIATDQHIVVRVETDAGPLPRTVRWRYIVKW